MKKPKIDYKTVDEYIAQCPKEIRPTLKKLRATIRAAAPDADERISYGMPGYYMERPLVYFAAYKNHIGLYPAPSGITAFKKELAGYACSKGAIQFPLDKPPFALVRAIVKYRVKESGNKAVMRAKR
ncbi:MAG: DUF1801 domain-containing protein [Spirochaetota bacterium]